MTRLRLLARSVRYYRRSNLAVVSGVATAVAVLSGALVVGDSVRESLRELALRRLGRVTQAVQARRFFREALSSELAPDGGAAPLITLRGTLSDEASGRRAYGVTVYGVDDRFWSLQGAAAVPRRGTREALVSPALRSELATEDGASLLLRVEAPSEVSGATLYGSRDDLGRTLRVTQGKAPPGVAEFSLRGSQRAVLAAFVPLSLLQRTLKEEARVNAVVMTGEADARVALRKAIHLEDLGLKLRVLEAQRALSLESEEALLSDGVVADAQVVAARLGLQSSPLLTYLANSISVGEHAVPYSLVTGVSDVDFDRLAKQSAATSPPGPAGQEVLVNDWAARELNAKAGQALELAYFVWDEAGRIVERRAAFVVAGNVPLDAGDRDMTPDYPGITESLHLSDWNPPFPVDLKKVRPRDEDYWNRYRGTPKAFVRLAVAQSLWGHRLGKLTALRLRVPDGSLNEAREAYARELLGRLEPARSGVEVAAVRREALVASRGSTDFDAYFLYFSFFLIASALLLVGLFFRLGVEQRLQEIGLLRSLGFTPRALFGQFAGEGLLLSALGSLPGAVLAAAFAGTVLFLLGRWGGDAVGTRALSLHASPRALIEGALVGIIVATSTSALAVRRLLRLEPRPLLLGVAEEARERARRGGRSLAWGVGAGLLALLLAGLSSGGRLDAVAGFFGVGASSLLAGLSLTRYWLARPARAVARSVRALGMRGVSQRPGRSLLSIALVASATFVVVALGAFRQEAVSGSDPQSGTGGYALVGESLLPIHYDFGTADGRQQLGLLGADAQTLGRARVARLRLRSGDDTSCLNLYLPQSPRVVGAPPDFVREARFAFAASLAGSGPERANPWLLLQQESAASEFPAIADQNSIEYVLHRKLGDAFEMDTPGAGRVRLRLVAALRASVFQSELLVSEAAFLRMFPSESGYRMFLVDAPKEQAAAVSGILEVRLADSGLDLQPAGERLARYLEVEHMYIATFQLLGGLGLLLGTAGLATVILRNAAERRRELGLLRAVGFRPGQLRTLALAENVVLLLAGLGIGSACALVAVVPAAGLRAARAPLAELMGLLVIVLSIGLVVARLAVRSAARGDVLGALRTD